MAALNFRLHNVHLTQDVHVCSPQRFCAILSLNFSSTHCHTPAVPPHLVCPRSAHCVQMLQQPSSSMSMGLQWHPAGIDHGWCAGTEDLP